MRDHWRSRLGHALCRHALLWKAYRQLNRLRLDAYARTRRSPRLRAVMVEITNHCNLDCVMCANRFVTRPRGFLSQEVFELLLRRIPSGSLDAIAMYDLGEPLLHPDLPGFCARVKAKAGSVHLSTNGVALRGNRSLADSLMAAVDHLHVSADGYDADSYEKVRRGARFEDLLLNLRILSEARDRHNPDARIELLYCLASPHTIAQLARAISLYGRFVDEVVFRPVTNQAHADLPYFPSEEVFGVSCFDASPHPCWMLWSTCTILWDGRVSACCRDYDGSFVMGDVHSQALHSVWSNDAYRTLRRDHARRRFPERCRTCSALLEEVPASFELNDRVRSLVRAASSSSVSRPAAQPGGRDRGGPSPTTTSRTAG